MTELKPGQIWKPKKEVKIYKLQESKAIILLSSRHDATTRYWTVAIFHFILDDHFDGAYQMELTDQEIIDNTTFSINLAAMMEVFNLI